MTALYKILNYCDIATRLDSTSPKRLDFRAYPAFRVTHLVQNVTAYAQRTAPPRTPAQKVSSRSLAPVRNVNRGGVG